MSYNNNRQVVSQEDRFNLVSSNENLFMESIKDEVVEWNKEKQFAIQALQGNDYLAGIAMKNPASLQNAIINIAAIGISLNPASKHAYLVPRKGSVCLDVSYMGLLHLAMSTGSIMWGQCKMVKANDAFELNGLAQEPTHKYQPFGDRGDFVGGYCTVKTASGDFLTDVMSVQEINDIMNRSESVKSGKSSPWKTDWSEMARKTIVKRAYKYWPKVERLNTAIDYLNNNNDEGLEREPVAPTITSQQMQQAEDEKRLEAIERCKSAVLEMGNCKSLDELNQSFVNINNYLEQNTSWGDIKGRVVLKYNEFKQALSGDQNATV